MRMQRKFISILLLIAMLLSMTITSAAITPTTDEIVDKATEVIISSEGTYKSVNPDDNGALSIGCIQWHATRALNLLKDIVNADPNAAYSILGQALYDEITTYTSWESRILTSDEASRISALIDTEIGRAKQDKLVQDNVLTYVNHGRNLGITNPAALVYFADLENQCGSGGASRIAASASEIAGNGEITLAILHQAALADKAAGKYPARRNKVYTYAALLGWDDILSATPYEVWKVDATLNIRCGPGVSYDRIAQYTQNTVVIIYEQTYVGSAKWGRTSVGWISLEYCVFMRSVAPSPGAYKLYFNPNGGDLLTEAKAILPINYINSLREAESLTVYTSEYGSTTGTNPYGSEIVVGPDGTARNNAEYGICNSEIPAGGFVISAHNSMSNTLNNNISKGDYIVYNAFNKTIEVYSSYDSYIASNKLAVCNAALGILPKVSKEGYIFDGWHTMYGTLFNENSVAPVDYSFTLYAYWTPVTTTVMFNPNLGDSTPATTTTTAHGVNVLRGEDMLVVYDNNRGETTGANKWGTEVAVNSAGVVTDIWPASGSGTGNHVIPQGGFVLSGHDVMSNWLLNNIEVGYRVTFDYQTWTVSVFTDDILVSESLTATYGKKLGTLPAPERDGYVFYGWYTEDDSVVTKDTVCNFTDSIIVKARWRKTSEAIAGDLNGDGKLDNTDLMALKKEFKLGNTLASEDIPTDVNGDGSLNVKDIIRLIKLIKSSL
ncbi:MAG: InlB B-repeat-containing protein [Clostridia bacterium]|nr:InlB B-repeat-containing protein [Clostridia bacterium]